MRRRPPGGGWRQSLTVAGDDQSLLLHTNGLAPELWTTDSLTLGVETICIEGDDDTLRPEQAPRDRGSRHTQQPCLSLQVDGPPLGLRHLH